LCPEMSLTFLHDALPIYMTYLFVSEDVGTIMNSVDIYLKCVGIFFIPLAVVNIYRNGIQGLGYGLLPMTAGIAELIGRGVVAVIDRKSTRLNSSHVSMSY